VTARRAPATLTTTRLRLSGLDPDRDAGDLHAAYADPRVMTPWLGEPPSVDAAQTRVRLAERAGLPGALLWAVRPVGEDVPVGLVEKLGGADGVGLTWMLRWSHWRRGIMSEAVAAVVEHLFASAPIDRVEAWANADNIGSIRVAQRCGLTERARFSRRDDLGILRETVVLGRFRRLDEPQGLFGVDAVLPVRDVDATVALLADGLGFSPGFRTGDPTAYAVVRIGPWTNSRGMRLRRAGPAAIAPVTVAIDCGTPIAHLHARYVAAGGLADGPPAERPWGGLEFSCLLPEGHRLDVSGRS
jgi:ribosomal-protein-alanine N-acetyltransferase